MRRTAAIAFCLLATVTALHSQAPAPPATAVTRPRLVVLIVVDQFRADYVDRYGAKWTGGLRRILDTGAYFRQAAYPFSATETCPGHTTIATGAFPSTHGIIANGWYDRATKRPVVCTTDTVKPIAIGDTAYEMHGAGNLRSTTLADELRAQTPGGSHVVSLSLKARAAMAMAGHRGDTVAWLEDSGSWATSSSFGDTAAPNAVAFVKAHPVDRDYDRVWNLLRPASSYAYIDDGVAEQAPDGWTVKFPHTLSRPDGPDRIYYDNWRRTPFGDEYLGAMAADLAQPLGRGPGTDMLAISFSSLDYVGHRFGPSSLEVQDTLARLDVTLGKLLDTLDVNIGRGRYVVALTADHGVAPLPEQQVAIGVDAGRIAPADIQAAIDKALDAAIGAGDHVMPGSAEAGNNSTDIYFTPETLSKLLAQPSLRHVVIDAVERVPGIARGIWADELLRIDDPDARALRLNFNADRNGDLLLVSKPYWIAASGGTGHGTAFAYDQRVPVVLMGLGIKPGIFDVTATPADIAPTLAYLAGVTLPRADGRVLGEAIRK